MDESESRLLQQRVARLERDIAGIKQMLEDIAPGLTERLRTDTGPVAPTLPRDTKPPDTAPERPAISGHPAPPPPPPPRPRPEAAARPPESTAEPPRAAEPHRPVPATRGFEIPEYMRKGEFWLNKVGIALILFGVAFAFKYSIDQGWITPPVRHLFGLAIGAILAVFGLRLYEKRRPFAQVLLGGSIGTFYITGFSAFQLFALVSHTTAFAFMIAVTLAAFYISLRQDDTIFSLIGTAGALGTPFLLYTGSGNLPGLVGYTCLVLAGTIAVYFFKGWRLLLWLSVIGGWVVLSIGIEGGELWHPGGDDTDRWAMQAGLWFAWLAFWLMPLARRLVRLKAPDRWAEPILGIGDKKLTAETRRVLDRHLHLLAIGSPLLALMLSIKSWPGVSDHIFGWGAMGATGLYWLVALYLRRIKTLGNLAYTHAAVGTLLLTLGFCLLLDGDTLLFTLAAEALVLHLIARRQTDRRISFSGHVLTVAVGIWLSVRLFLETADQPAFFNTQALTDLWAVATVTAASWIVSRPTARRLYFFGAALGLAFLFNRELSGNLLFFMMVIEAASLHFVARWIGDETLVTVSDLGFAAMAVWLGNRFWELGPAGLPFWNYQAGVEIALIAAALVVAWRYGQRTEGRVYLLVSFAAIAGLLWRELDGNALLVALTIEAVGLHMIAYGRNDRALCAGVHVLTAAIAVWLLERLTDVRIADDAFLNAVAVADLLFVAAVLRVSTLLKSSEEKLVYRLVAHFALLGWFSRELLPLDNGQGYVSVAWGLYGAALLVAGLRRNVHGLRLAGLGTLMLVVGKLFVVDLARLETIWRVLLFVGFGGVFLLLSYFFPKLWKKGDRPDAEVPE